MNEAPHAHQPALLTGLSSRLVPELKRYLQHHAERVLSLIESYGEHAGATAAARRAQAVDGLLSSLFHAVTAVTPGGAPFALGAVGSYGRATLSLYSDLDVRVLCASNPEASAPLVEALLYPLWDVGLNIGHQVVPLDEVVDLARGDLPTATSMLDWRHVAGSRDLSDQLLARCYANVFGPDDIGAFLQKLQQASYARKERYGASVFLLEPDLKNGSGGLRDVDLAHWAARARWRVRKLEELVALGVLLPDEWTDFHESIEFLMRLRNVLHVTKKRKVDRIGFEEQELLAQIFKYGSGGQGAESLMSDYYRHARVVELTSEMILRRAMPPPKIKPQELILGDGTKVVGDTVAVEDEDALFLEPWLAFLVFSQAVRRELKVAEPTRRAITRAVASEAFQERLRADSRSIELFRQLVCEPKETRFRFGSVLTELHEVGLLLAMIPEFLPVVGRVHHDIYHVYTVDIHSIAAVDKQRGVFRGVEAKALPLATQIARSCEHREVVFFATLLHDVGKDAGGRQHAARGAELARQILARLQFEPSDIDAVATLIDTHLKMYLYATRRDIDDIRTLESFSRAVVNEQGLRNLYLLTIADVSTTSPTSLNLWKLKMLDDLFAATHRYLVDGELRRVASDKLVQTIRERAPASVPTPFIEAFLHSVPTRYLTAFEPDAVVEHLKLAVGAQQGLALAVTRQSSPHTEICVIGDDEPGFLAKVCAVFAHAKFKVVSAQIHSWRDADGRRRALDSFWVRGSSGAVLARLPEVELRLRQVVAGELAALELVGPPGESHGLSQRPAPAVPIQVRIDNEGATDRTIVEVITKDRVGLLFWISETIFECGLSIDLAKIHTEGARVTDVFYVTTEDHKKLLDANRLACLRERLTERLKRLEAKSN